MPAEREMRSTWLDREGKEGRHTLGHADLRGQHVRRSINAEVNVPSSALRDMQWALTAQTPCQFPSCLLRLDCGTRASVILDNEHARRRRQRW